MRRKGLNSHRKRAVRPMTNVTGSTARAIIPRDSWKIIPYRMYAKSNTLTYTTERRSNGLDRKLIHNDLVLNGNTQFRTRFLGLGNLSKFLVTSMITISKTRHSFSNL